MQVVVCKLVTAEHKVHLAGGEEGTSLITRAIEHRGCGNLEGRSAWGKGDGGGRCRQVWRGSSCGGDRGGRGSRGSWLRLLGLQKVPDLGELVFEAREARVGVMDMPVYVGNPVFKPGGMLGRHLHSGFTIIGGHFTQMRVGHVEKTSQGGEGELQGKRGRGLGAGGWLLVPEKRLLCCKGDLWALARSSGLVKGDPKVSIKY